MAQKQTIFKKQEKLEEPLYSRILVLKKNKAKGLSMAIETYKYNLKIRAGRTVRKKWTFYTKNEDNELVLINTTGWQGLLQYRETVDSSAYIDFLSSETSPQLITFGGANGEMVLLFTPEKTLAMREFKKLVYDLRITYPDGDVDYPLAGELKITKSVTRD